MTEDGARGFLQRQTGSRGDERGQYHAFAVVHRDDGRMIGDVGVFLPVSPLDEGDLGFQFNPTYWGQGFAREAARAFVGHLFAQGALERLTAGCDRENEASSRLLTSLGMRLRSEDAKDSLTFELTREAWAASPSGG